MEVAMYKFKLFISGMSVHSANAIENLKSICEEYLPDGFELEIIDITRERKKATEYQVFAIPTLIKTEPGPARTILGDLSNRDKVLKILDLK